MKKKSKYKAIRINDPNRDVFDVLAELGELAPCKECGRRIWTRWNRYKDKIDICAPCESKNG